MIPEFNAFFRAIDSPYSNKEKIERAWKNFLATSPHPEEIKIIINELTKREEGKVGVFLQKAYELFLEMNSKPQKKTFQNLKGKRVKPSEKKIFFFFLQDQ